VKSQPSSTPKSFDWLLFRKLIDSFDQSQLQENHQGKK
jgi:hypothetical protein